MLHWHRPCVTSMSILARRDSVASQSAVCACPPLVPPQVQSADPHSPLTKKAAVPRPLEFARGTSTHVRIPPALLMRPALMMAPSALLTPPAAPTTAKVAILAPRTSLRLATQLMIAIGPIASPLLMALRPLSLSPTIVQVPLIAGLTSASLETSLPTSLARAPRFPSPMMRR
jgi:hypothetical protein